ncbi:MAG: OsmC family protein [Bacteroidota bacterium]
MKESVTVSWTGGMSFEADVNGHKITIDAAPDAGGQDKGPKPKPLMMVALAGCTGMDVVSILKKMRVEYESLDINVEGELTEEHPKKFVKMKVIYSFKGTDLPLDKIKKAIKLSEETYCGVSASYKDVMDLFYEIKINES